MTVAWEAKSTTASVYINVTYLLKRDGRLRKEPAVGGSACVQSDRSFPEHDTLEVRSGACSNCSRRDPYDVARERAAGENHFFTSRDNQSSRNLKDPCCARKRVAVSRVVEHASAGGLTVCGGTRDSHIAADADRAVPQVQPRGQGEAADAACVSIRREPIKKCMQL